MIFFKNIVIFIVLARIALNYSKLSLNSELEAIQLENCLWKTYKNFLKPINSIVFLQLNISDVIILRKLHKEQKFMIQIKLFLDDSLILESLPKTSSYFIQFNKENDIIMLFDNLQMKLFNYRAKINFISTTIFENPLNIFAFISNFTANLNIFNVNIYLRNESSSCSLKWIVFKQENRMDEIRVVFIKRPPIFIRNPKDNSLFGVDYKILETFAKASNLSISFKEERKWGTIVNGTPTGALQELQNGQYDIAAGGYLLTYPREQYFDFTTSYEEDIMIWCIKTVQTLNISKALLRMFDLKTWICILMVSLVNSFTILVLSRLNINEIPYYKQLSNILLINVATLTNNSGTILPKTFRIRFVLFLLIVFNVILNILYTTFLTSILSRPNFDEKYKTVGDIFENNFSLYFVASLKNLYLKHVSNKPQLQLYNCNDTFECMKYVAVTENTAMCAPYLRLQAEHFLYGKLYCFKKEPIIRSSLTMYLQRGFLYQKQLNRIIIRLSESGFIRKWKLDALELYNNASQIEKNQSFLTFSKLRIIFVIYLLSQTISVVVFLMELFAHKGKRKIPFLN